MKRTVSLLTLIASLLLIGGGAFAQSSDDPGQQLENLRRQLFEIKDHEAGVKMRLTQLEVDLKPENIERYFQGYGSTRPEELREARRRQLQTEKDRLEEQLRELADTRNRLEMDISSTQARVYQQSALGSTSISPNENRGPAFFTMTRVLVSLIVILLVVGSLIARIMIRRRTHI